MHAEGLPYAIFLLTLVLIAQAVFLLEHRRTNIQIHTQTNNVTDSTDQPTYTLATADAAVNKPCSRYVELV